MWADAAWAPRSARSAMRANRGRSMDKSWARARRTHALSSKCLPALRSSGHSQCWRRPAPPTPPAPTRHTSPPHPAASGSVASSASCSTPPLLHTSALRPLLSSSPPPNNPTATTRRCSSLARCSSTTTSATRRPFARPRLPYLLTSCRPSLTTGVSAFASRALAPRPGAARPPPAATARPAPPMPGSCWASWARSGPRWSRAW